MSEFKIDTPANIDNLSDEEIRVLCNTFGDIKSPKVRIKMIKTIYKVLGYDLSPDLLYALADETKEQLIIALAGGGKTTSMSVKINLQKIYRRSKYTNSGKVVGDRILSLVYNSKNVQDMIDKNQQVVSKINGLGIPDLQLDYNLECKTMHSFCLKWLRLPEYSNFLGLINYSLIEPDRQTNMLTTAIASICKKEGIEVIPPGLKAHNVTSLHNYCVETKCTLEDLRDSEKVVDLGVDLPIIEKIIKIYTNTKKRARLYDYTDLLVNFKKLLDTNPEAKQRIKCYYDYIVADEIQDFTPLLMDILYDIVGEDTSLVCIGDDDQSIYAFRGADNNNALRFKDIFPNSKIHLLKTNRRCPSNVLNLADQVIKLNEDRYPKEMLGIKGPGEIHFRGYNDRIGQYYSIVNLIKDFNDEDRMNSIIAYREKHSSYVLSQLFYESNMPFHVISGHGPFDFELYRHIFSVMNALNSGGDKRKLLNLYKVLPVSKAEVQEALHYDPIKNIFTDDKNYVDIDKIEFSTIRMKNEVFVKSYSFLIAISKQIDSLPVNTYMGNLIGLIQRNFWKFLTKDSKLDPSVFDFCTKKCLEFFNRSFTYKELYAMYLSERDRLRKWNTSNAGVGLSTFHSLKGLEFKNTIICDLAESIFPNYSGIDFRPYNAETKKSLRECENRLFYVAITRSKKNLYFFYSNSDPSCYINMLKEKSYEQASIGHLFNEDGVAEVSVKPSEVFNKLSESVIITNDPIPNEAVEEEVSVAEEDLGQGVTIKSKEVRANYNNSYMNNLMGSLFKK